VKTIAERIMALSKVSNICIMVTGEGKWRTIAHSSGAAFDTLERALEQHEAFCRRNAAESVRGARAELDLATARQREVEDALK
jgi:hypothetical protein